jgi:hypothetical protein
LTPHLCWLIFADEDKPSLVSKRRPIMQESPLQIIEKEAAKLSLRDHIKLMKTLARHLRAKSESTKHGLDWGGI